mgnify:CR=1 FL=1
MQHNYKEIRKLLNYRENFKGNSTEGLKQLESYNVWSYNTMILKETKDSIYFNNRYYSVTTSKIQNMIKSSFGLTDCKERIVYNINK